MNGLVFPRSRAEHHPAASSLKEYAATGCSVSLGWDRTLEELEAAVARGPHVSALEDDTIDQIQIEAREKVKQSFATIHHWKDLKQNVPKALKLSPLAMTPDKSRKY